MTKGMSSNGMRRFRRRLSAATCTLAFLIAFSTGLVYGGNAIGYRAGYNSSVSFDLQNLTAVMHDAWHSTAVTDVSPTDISATHTHNAFSGEVRVLDAIYQSPAYGWYECHEGQWEPVLGKTVCTHGHVHIDLFEPPGGTFSALEAQSLMCEEVGHSVGLAHSSEDASCMSQQWNRNDFTPHDDAVLNGFY